MVNHVRTYLLNTARSASLTTLPDYVHIPAAFIPRKVSDVVSRVRKIIFGSFPDGTFLHTRAGELLRCLHSSELAYLVTQTDARLTYLPFSASLRADRNARASVSTIFANAGQELTVLGDRIVDGETLRKEWLVEVISSSDVRITTQQATQTTVAYTEDDNLSSVIPLPDSDLSVRFSSGTGAVWRLVSIAKPPVDLEQALLAVRYAATSAELSPLFGLLPATVREIWDARRSVASDAAALAITLAAATEAEV